MLRVDVKRIAVFLDVHKILGHADVIRVSNRKTRVLIAIYKQLQLAFQGVTGVHLEVVHAAPHRFAGNRILTVAGLARSREVHIAGICSAAFAVVHVFYPRELNGLIGYRLGGDLRACRRLDVVDFHKLHVIHRATLHIGLDSVLVFAAQHIQLAVLQVAHGVGDIGEQLAVSVVLTDNNDCFARKGRFG